MDQLVRRIRADEWRRYRQLRLEALKDSPLAFVEQYDEALTRPDSYWQDRVARNAAGTASGTFVAVHAGEFAGKVSCFVEPEITDRVSGHIVGVYVTPRLRGRGVIDPLMTVVIRWARAEPGADRIRLFVMENNERAAACYRRLGFVFTGASMAYPPDPTYTELEMELTVY